MWTPLFVVRFAHEVVASLVAPARCSACDVPVAPLATFCKSCESTVERADGGSSESVVAAFYYCGAISRAIGRLKYEQRPDLARPLGDLLSGALLPRVAALDTVVVPVPLHPLRLAERGFNQSALLARRVAHRLGAICAPLALARLRDTPPQAKLDREARLTNVARAFGTRQPERVCGRTVVLVDDVRTTGATMHACADELVRSGAARVVQAAVATVSATDA